MSEDLRNIINRFRSRESPSLMMSVIPDPDVMEILESRFPNDPLEHLGNFRIPDFQRPSVWTQEQEIKLIENIWRGIPIGTYSVNMIPPMNGDDLAQYSELLLDGQQRVRAIVNYCNDEFPVFNRLFSELSKADKRYFKQMKFPHCETQYTDWNEIKEYYDTMNFSGIAHSPDMRATAGYRRPPHNPPSP